jgi:uncharacterized protein (DUF427 family)
MAVERAGPPFKHFEYVRTPRWVRAVRGGEIVVDSRRALLVWHPGRKVPVYAFPDADVDPRVGGPDALRYDDPELRGYVTLDWNAVDRWLEEDEEVLVHPRDPFARVDALASTRAVRVEVDGRTVAESSRPVLLFETGLPPRCYLPRDDVDTAVLRPSGTHSECPYKGVASYHHVVVGDRRHEDLVWYYPDPLPGLSAIRDRLAFYNDRAAITADGQRM